MWGGRGEHERRALRRPRRRSHLRAVAPTDEVCEPPTTTERPNVPDNAGATPLRRTEQRAEAVEVVPGVAGPCPPVVFAASGQIDLESGLPLRRSLGQLISQASRPSTVPA